MMMVDCEMVDCEMRWLMRWDGGKWDGRWDDG